MSLLSHLQVSSIILGDVNIDVDEIALAKQRQHSKIGKLSSSMADSSAHNPKQIIVL